MACMTGGGGRGGRVRSDCAPSDVVRPSRHSAVVLCHAPADRREDFSLSEGVALRACDEVTIGNGAEQRSPETVVPGVIAEPAADIRAGDQPEFGRTFS
jgi:hypothetical protein